MTVTVDKTTFTVVLTALVIAAIFGAAHTVRGVKQADTTLEEECYYLPSGFKTQAKHDWKLLSPVDRARVDRLVDEGKAEKELETTSYCLVYEVRGNQTSAPTLVMRKNWWWRMKPPQEKAKATHAVIRGYL